MSNPFVEPSTPLPFPVQPVAPQRQPEPMQTPIVALPPTLPPLVLAPPVDVQPVPPPVRPQQPMIVIPQAPEAQISNNHTIPEVAAIPFGYGVHNENVGIQPVQQQNYYSTPSVFGQEKNNYNTPIKQENIGTDVIDTKQSNRWRLFTIISSILIGIALIVIVSFFSVNMGFAGTLVATAAALIPFGVITLVIWWLGRFDPEPLGLRIGAWFWGIGLSILTVLGLTLLTNNVIGDASNDLFTAVSIEAPLIEEFSKGLGVVLIALIFWKRIDGPIDGVVFSTIIAGGFAFTENIEYLSAAYVGSGSGIEGLIGLGMTWFGRAVLSPFAHVMFSSIMGMMIGYAKMRGFRRITVVGLWLAVWPISASLHALWNGSNIVGGTDWNIFYLLIELPLFIAIISYVAWLRHSEIENTYKRMYGFASGGWFKEYEVDALATMKGRQRLRAWARKQPEQVKLVISNLTHQVTDLSYLHRRISTTKNETKKQELLKVESNLITTIQKEKNSLIRE